MLKQLKYFQSVVRLNSFSKAAEENFISQSAVSQQIQTLERELGFRLLERKNRTFTLTPAGEYFYRKSLILTADFEQMCSEAAKIANGNRASLKIGYLRCYTGAEFNRALELFSEKHPNVEVSVIYGNHEELFSLLRTEEADLVFNDQRRTFSDEYVNLLLTTCRSCIELSAHSLPAQMKRISPSELKNIPCILVTSEAQRETEQEYYRDVIGFHGEFLYAENLEEARLMVIGRKGFLHVDGAGKSSAAGTSVTVLPLMRGEEPILRNYCAFWKKGNSGYYVEEFAELLKAQFENRNNITENRTTEND
ncbi:MAG: LysR family transcriptional regulator [Ruminococcus sp.]|nr:LysR family transcriptional regulator [Ruminococcus sp.]MDY3895209.1 LysR family transcriptional regulator [Candidatus Fimenecus sp.]